MTRDRIGTRVPPACAAALMAALIATGLSGCGGRTEEDRHSEAAEPSVQTVRLSEEAVRAAGIATVPVSREVFHPHVVASGVIRPVAEKSVMVRATASGRVVRVLADVGQRVRSGQNLAEVESQDLTAAVARHRTAIARRRAALKSLQRAEALLEIRGISQAEVDLRGAESDVAAAEAEAAGRDLARLGIDPDALAHASSPTSAFTITAPLPGIVLSRAVSPGLLVEKDALLFEIADLQTVWAMADVYEKDLGLIQERGEVEVRTDAYADTLFLGRIVLIEPALDEESRTAHVRVVLDNRQGKLRPGMFVTVAVPLRGASEIEATAVPDDAVQKIAGLPAVFVERGPGMYELCPVETGLEAHGMVEIRHGLKEGDTVVTRGAFILKSELLKSSIAGEEH
jgi:cobalt-zinc-cadmium efflux system membrane fusion protein